MLSDSSALRDARGDTLINRAPSDYLERLSSLYGLYLSATGTPHSSQQSFGHHALYSVRGSYTSLISTLIGIFGHLILKESVTLTPASAPYLSGSGITAAWGEERLIRIDGSLYHATHYDAALSRLYLSPARALAIQGAPTTGTPGTVDAELLPFTIREPQPATQRKPRRSQEAPCTVIIDLISSETRTTPPSYWRENADARSSDPFGSHILDLFSSTEEERVGDQSTGPYPLYFEGSDLGPALINLFDLLLASGIKLEMKLKRTYSP